MASSIVGIGPTWLGRRQMGFKNPLGTKSHIYEQMYSNILPYGSWDHTFNNTYTSVHGSVFCLEFSPEGSLLVAACEKRSVLMFDPLTHKRIHSVENAHLDCVNCVRFLDSRSFATCSDDFTVALWDARNLSHKVRSLKGHSNWVKNIEYSTQDGLLVTSGFDGSILTWEINTCKEGDIAYNKVFSTNGLMRTRLTPDATKMVICTTGGYLIIVHNLDLNAMSQDLEGFKPNMYRFMQLSQTILPVASDFTHLFRGRGKRNRVEFITDFPEEDDAEVVSSLQIHPDGHCAISRNVSYNEESEWSCIHNIEERLSSDDSDFTDDDSCDEVEGCKMINWPGTSTSVSTTPSYIIQHTVVQNPISLASTDAGSSSEQRDLSVSPSDVWEALVAIQEARIRRESDAMASEMSMGHMFRRQVIDSGTRTRPANVESQIFVRRVLPNLASNTNSEEGFRELQDQNSAPEFRRNMSVNTTQIMPRNVNQKNLSSFSRSNKSTARNKLPVRQRYASLYRRSLVGQYDRTSILRKPIYNHGIIELKLKKLKRRIKLNTNYEINETRRLQNEFDNNRHSSDSSFDLQNGMFDQACSSETRVTDSTTFHLPKQIHSKCKNGLRKISTINSSMDSSKQNLSTLKDNINSFSENFNSSLEDSVDSTCDSFGRNESVLEVTNDGEQKNSERQSTTGNESSLTNSSYSAISEPASENTNETVDHEEIIETELSNSSGELSRNSNFDQSVSSSKVENSPSQASCGRTVLMGVFKPEKEDGIKGTSMRKHNVAAVTVSSRTETKTNSLSNSDHLEKRKSKKYSNNHKNRNRHNSYASTNLKSSSVKSNGAHSTYRSTSSRGNIYCSSQRYPLVPVNKKIHQNLKRLTHYVEEPNLGRGFIKELCVSPDGRIICSPFGSGIRLLSFSPTVQDVFHCYPTSPPIPLHELTLNIAHTDIVVSTKFSPFHNLLVSGCLSGKIVYYQPFL